ncbi:MAG TPA: ABC transporter substrate-binding protein [Pseudolabrys sp.]|jgi:ABC-type nitrate/sulfonate/bicarbonate transport system substrate-binding protein|nr:ABC transporter substrate-binding protein [Pseudolabrys sp.]
MTEKYGLTRRQALAATGAGIMAAGLGLKPAFADSVTIRQGYQTNMWGMPTYYLMRSGHLKKHGIDAKEFAVPSGNLTMQQMVARQVDLGTFAGPSFIIGNEKGGLIAIAKIEYVGKTARLMARKDLGITKVEQLRGKKIANQTGSSVGNILVDEILPKAGLHKGDYTEVRMNVNDMVAAMAAKTVDAMANVEPYNAIAEANGIANTLVDFYSFDKMPVFMAATPDFVGEHADAVVPYLKAWIDVANDFKNEPDKVHDVVYKFYTSKGYKMDKKTFINAISRVEVNLDWPDDLDPYMTHHAEVLIKAHKVKKVPDWSKAFRKDFMKKARG